MNFDLKAHTLLLTIAGSRAYGIHTQESDVDVKGVAVPPPRYFFGTLDRFAHADKSDDLASFDDALTDDERAAAAASKLEGVVYSLDKFCRLAMDGNPNVFDLLFCREQDVRIATAQGERLRDCRQMFLSAKCKHTFSGYAFQQLHRIKLHRRWLLHPQTEPPQRADYNVFAGIEPKQVKAALAAVRKVIDGWELDLSRLEASERIPILSGIANTLAEITVASDPRWQAAARSIGYDENFLQILERERRWVAANDDWKKFQQWKRSRNPDRAALEEKFGYDTKHGAHLFRLLKMAEEILLLGEVRIWREDREEILAVRRGEWSYDKLVEWAEAKDAELERAYRAKTFAVPDKPDRAGINALCIELTEAALASQ